VIARAPAGHEARAEYWTAYLEDRHAAMLAARGEREKALSAGRRARRAWHRLDREDEAERMRQELARWSAAGPPRHAGPRPPHDEQPS
jgi:hypothetical protein